MIILLGPTASGKTSISIELAEKLNGEIVGADSVQIYKDLVIGSAAPTKEEMNRIPHHLIGIMNLSSKISAGQYVRMATETVKDIETRGKLPIMVGGTNFYVDAFINGLSPIPEISDQENSEFDKKTDDIPTEDLFSQLKEKDPEWAETISSPNDRQRIKRGLLVLESTGKKISQWNKFPREKVYFGDLHVFALEINRNKLYERINLRSEKMIRDGIIEELQRINIKGYNSDNCLPLNSIGYKETGLFLNGTITTREDLVELIARNTRHLAKRQLTWLRNRNYVNWIERKKSIEFILNMKNRI